MNPTTPSLQSQLQALGYDSQLTAQWLDDARTLEPSLVFDPVWWRNEQELERVGRQMCFPTFVLEGYQQARHRIETTCPQWWGFLALADRMYRAKYASIRHRLSVRPVPPKDHWDALSDFTYAMICLTGLKAMMDRHKMLGIEQQVTIDTIHDLPGRIEGWRQRHGSLRMAQTFWLSNHLRCELFALGRLQFAPGRFALPFHVFEDEQKHIAVLLDMGRTMRSDGQFATADHEAAIHAPDNWTSTFQQTSEAWIGHRIDPQGRASRETTSLPRSRWRRVIHTTSNVLCVHIPHGSRLDPQACQASFAKARTFFPRHLSFVYQGSTCTSWLMDPLLQQILDSSSNLVQFQKMFDLLPCSRANDRQMFERVFDGMTDVKRAPRDTTLRRLVLEAIEKGQHFRTASGIRVECSEPV